LNSTEAQSWQDTAPPEPFATVLFSNVLVLLTRRVDSVSQREKVRNERGTQCEYEGSKTSKNKQKQPTNFNLIKTSGGNKKTKHITLSSLT
jgi:hypothetical protein